MVTFKDQGQALKGKQHFQNISAYRLNNAVDVSINAATVVLLLNCEKLMSHPEQANVAALKLLPESPPGLRLERSSAS